MSCYSRAKLNLVWHSFSTAFETGLIGLKVDEFLVRLIICGQNAYVRQGPPMLVCTNNVYIVIKTSLLRGVIKNIIYTIRTGYDSWKIWGWSILEFPKVRQGKV